VGRTGDAGVVVATKGTRDGAPGPRGSVATVRGRRRTP